MCAAMLASGPTAMMRSPAIATAFVIIDWPSMVMILPFLSTRSAARVAADCAAAGKRSPAVRPATVTVLAAPLRKLRRGIVLVAMVVLFPYERTSIAGEPHGGHGRRG